jgi:hypothetical protein
VAAEIDANGLMHAPTRPGLGGQIDFDLIARNGGGLVVAVAGRKMVPQGAPFWQPLRPVASRRRRFRAKGEASDQVKTLANTTKSSRPTLHDQPESSLGRDSPAVSLRPPLVPPST